MSKYRPIHESVHPMGTGTHAIYRFDNGYGASVIRTPMSYGGSTGLFEVAVVRFDKDEYEITYDTCLTDDVIGNLSPEEVEALLDRIAELPKEA